MAILSNEDFLNRVKEHFGESPDDAGLAFMEDILDTYNDANTRAAAGTGDGEDWKAKYDALDASWRKRYTERFYQGTNVSNNDLPTPDTNLSAPTEPEPAPEPLTFDGLFE